MQKIMFNDRYGLTDAVLRGSKTQTRRIIKLDKLGEYNFDNALKHDWGKMSIQAFIKNYAIYKVGEVVAVAQSYEDCIYECIRETGLEATIKPHLGKEAGYKNKMFVKAEYMPHHIRITGIRVQRLQDISDEDCLKEGIWKANNVGLNGITYWYPNLFNSTFRTPREAYAALIDRVSGKGTWAINPFVVAYEFEKID